MIIAKKILKALSLSSLLLVSHNSFALEIFLEQWRDFYPQSTSSEIRCQLCHVQRSGGDPWNAYGRDIRNFFRSLDVQTRTIEQAFEGVELENSDGDNPNRNNLVEINANEQPGWRLGRVNIAYNRNDFEVGVFTQPISINPITAEIQTTNLPLQLVEVANGFTSPLGGVTSPVRSLQDQLFVVDQIGIVWRVNTTNGDKSQYIDVSEKLVQLGAFTPGGYDERGLLGFAFHPDFSNNGRVYLYLSSPVQNTADFTTLNNDETPDHQSVVLELTINNPSAAAGVASIASEREILRIDQPQFNHNGGALVFDDENNLYIALGDGGGAEDEGIGHSDLGNGSDPLNPLGSILRINPLGNNSSNRRYGIPLDNPFINDADALDEIFAYGFRNPWKLSFDQSGKLYAADVGQNDIEEINLVESGQFYGWRFKEGRFFFDSNNEFGSIVTTEFPDNLPPVRLIDPILEYDHDEGISVIGGYVYQNEEAPELLGKYIFADFTKRLFIGDLETGEILATGIQPNIFVYGFAQDSNNELYFMGNETALTSGKTGKLMRFEPNPEQVELCFPVKPGDDQVSIVCL